jgi:hypothetical protein
MPTQQERRDGERKACRLVYPYELTKPVDKSTAQLLDGHVYAINRSVRGVLLLLPEEVDKRHVFEIRAPSKARREQIIELVEVCWTRPIPVSARVKMHLVGTRILFEPPAPGQSPQIHPALYHQNPSETL